jgi:hypothetical protein
MQTKIQLIQNNSDNYRARMSVVFRMQRPNQIKLLTIVNAKIV